MAENPMQERLAPHGGRHVFALWARTEQARSRAPVKQRRIPVKGFRSYGFDDGEQLVLVLRVVRKTFSTWRGEAPRA